MKMPSGISESSKVALEEAHEALVRLSRILSEQEKELRRLRKTAVKKKHKAKSKFERVYERIFKEKR